MPLGVCPEQVKAPAPPRAAEVPETELYPVENIDFAAPPPLLVDTGIKCDGRGNIYMVYSDAPQAVLSQRNGIPKLPIQKLSLEHKNAVSFPTPVIQGYQDATRFDFDVDAHGRVYALVAASTVPDEGSQPRVDYLVVRYRDDGTLDSYMKLAQTPREAPRAGTIRGVRGWAPVVGGQCV
jgi:hypothetical protein